MVEDIFVKTQNEPLDYPIEQDVPDDVKMNEPHVFKKKKKQKKKVSKHFGMELTLVYLKYRDFK